MIDGWLSCKVGDEKKLLGRSQEEEVSDKPAFDGLSRCAYSVSREPPKSRLRIIEADKEYRDKEGNPVSFALISGRSEVEAAKPLKL